MGDLLKTGRTVEVDIASVAFGGEGIARIDNLVLFVPFTVEGDRVEVEIREVKKRYLRGRLRKIVTASSFRVEPPCPRFGRCGGCQYQHIAYEKQLALKERQVVDACERVGRLQSPPVRPMLASPRAYGYRGKGEFHVERAPGGKRIVGFLDVAGRRLVDVPRCEIMEESINEDLETIRGRGADEVAEGEERLILWSRQGEGEDPDPAVVRRVVKGKVLLAPRDGFFQANAALVETLVDQVLGMSAAGGDEEVLECYCGSGLFSLFLAQRCQSFSGIEIDPDAVDCGRRNLEIHGLTNAAFFSGDVGDVLQAEFVEKKRKADLVVLDPPRTGCERDVLQTLVALGPSRIVYVSCDPATQARDAACLADAGYDLRVLQPIDMFPQTKHIEAVALFEKRS